MIVTHRPGKLHVNADAFSHIPDSVECYGNYSNNIDVSQLPCHPCTFCTHSHNQWSRFFNDVDYIVPLSMRNIKLSIDVIYYEENWGTKHSVKDLRNFQKNDPNLSIIIIKWFESGIKPSESDLALSSSTLKHLAACSKNKKINRRKIAGMIQYHAESPMERAHLDVFGPFNKFSNDSKICPWYDQSIYEMAGMSPSTRSVCRKNAIYAIDEFLCRFGMPLTIHTYQGNNFVGNFLKSVCELLEIRKTQTTPYHPESNGQIERYNRTIVEKIHCLKLKSETDWDIHLPHMTSAIRCLENPSTGFTANRLVSGWEAHKSVHIHFNLMHKKFVNVGDYVRKLDEVLRETHRISRNNLKGAWRTRKKDYD